MTLAQPPIGLRHTWLADGCLLMAALLWGSGFVAQRVISEHLGPLAFNGMRNLIALLALTPFVLRTGDPLRPTPRPPFRLALLAGLATGLPLFLGGWVQQAGIARTTAGKAGFITGLYVVLVPMIAALAGTRLPRSTWPAAALGTAGLYLLSATRDWSLGQGDLLVLVSAGCWAFHVHAVGHFSRRLGGQWLGWLQVLVATAFSLPLAFHMERPGLEALRATTLPLLYSGLCCGALAFGLQIAGQRHAPPPHAAILMSLESVFAALFGWLLLGERLGPRGALGATLMLAGMLVSQWPALRRRTTKGAAVATGTRAGG